MNHQGDQSNLPGQGELLTLAIALHGNSFRESADETRLALLKNTLSAWRIAQVVLDGAAEDPEEAEIRLKSEALDADVSRGSITMKQAKAKVATPLDSPDAFGRINYSIPQAMKLLNYKQERGFWKLIAAYDRKEAEKSKQPPLSVNSKSAELAQSATSKTSEVIGGTNVEPTGATAVETSPPTVPARPQNSSATQITDKPDSQQVKSVNKRDIKTGPMAQMIRTLRSVEADQLTMLLKFKRVRNREGRVAGGRETAKRRAQAKFAKIAPSAPPSSGAEQPG